MKKNTKELLISREVNDFYTRSSEEDRLTMGLGPLEFERNRLLIGRFLPKGTGVIADIGGGTGKYSEWLAGLGHDVWLVDPVKKHILQAQKRSDRAARKFHVILGEGRSLDFPDNFADMVIVHGPLYHLPEKHDRLQAVSEAKRIAKPGGVVLGFAISYTASTIVSLLQGMIHQDSIFNMCRSELLTGEHTAPPDLPGILTGAYFHRPEELRSEFSETGLKNIEMFAVEGIIWLDKNFFSARADKIKSEHLQELSAITEKDPDLLSFSPHFMISGIK